MYPCSVILVNSSFIINIDGKKIKANKNHAFLTDSRSRYDFYVYSSKFTELKISEKTITKYLEYTCIPLYVENPNVTHYIKAPLEEVSILRSIIRKLNSDTLLPIAFSEQMFFTCISAFSEQTGFLSLLVKSINSLVMKIRCIIYSQPSRIWKMKDIGQYLYMSESSIKRKLYEENTSFSQILLDVRMQHARRLMISELSINKLATRCGYSSTSYFISTFRQYFGITPMEMKKNMINIS
ncbi:helix-turn-helix domain-containing protein [Escherichia coli]|nr:helix-turn-helix domain-containing protein [Escherichia coli]EFN7694355.1 helix-turn-helix domain-containing protein [Escherichia coli]EFN7779459.1 helix-turn-helix domain-containing protein [Escherichia coli]EFN7794341.1 helix-turn-helix domain-containing protein [Escherichia coli]EHR0347108.1 helix-turn-helix domain-containing protein [Escherichia coli]